jgi:hypothetical protein
MSSEILDFKLSPSHSSYLPAYEDGTESSETLAYKILTPGNYPEESTKQTTKFVGPTPCHLTP